MKTATKFSIALAVAAFVPLATATLVSGDIHDPRQSMAISIGFATALALSILGPSIFGRWMYGKGLDAVKGITESVRQGSYDRIPTCQPQGSTDGENEFTAAIRSLFWMAHRIENREEELRCAIRELDDAKRRLERREIDLREANDRLTVLAQTDALTGISNRRAFFDTLGRIAESRTDGVSVLMLDIDHFKRVNDSLGHQAGDSILVEFARRLKSAIRRTDLVARVGGEEFAILLADIGVDETLAVAAGVLNSIRAATFRVPDDRTPTVPVTCSIGICSIRRGCPIPPETLYKNADEALYAAKNNGRNRVYLFDCASCSVLPAAS